MIKKMFKKQFLRKNQKIGIFIFCLLELLFLTTNVIVAEDINPYGKFYAPPPQVQLEKEGIDDQVGKGRIFVPAMSKPELEPKYSIYQNGKLVKSNCQVGQSIFLDSGKYTIYIGSADFEDKKIKVEVDLEEEETYIVPICWSGLIVKIIDQNRNYLRAAYEIFEINDYKNSIGMKWSADEDEPGEEQETWILKPSLYKLIKYKENPKTFINFTTVQLHSCELVTITIVMDNTNLNFIGAGILPELAELDKEKNWSRYTSVNGSFLLNSDNSESKDENKTNITLSSKLENEVKLDKFPHYFNSNQKLNVGVNKEHGQDFRIYSNSLQVPTTYIFYFFKSFGVYSRFRLDANVFPSTYYFTSEQDTIYKYDENGNLIKIITDEDKVQIAPMLFPVRFEEGLGLNLSLLKTNRSNFSIKTGFGFSQTFNKDVFEQDNTIQNRFNELKSVYLSGIEGSISGDFRISNNITDVFEIYSLYPFEADREQTYRFENTVTFRISNYFSLDYTLTLNKDESKDWVVNEHNLSLDLTLISF